MRALVLTALTAWTLVLVAGGLMFIREALHPCESEQEEPASEEEDASMFVVAVRQVLLNALEEIANGLDDAVNRAIVDDAAAWLLEVEGGDAVV